MMYNLHGRLEAPAAWLDEDVGASVIVLQRRGRRFFVPRWDARRIMVTL